MATTPIAFVGLDHIVLRARDIGRMVAFYRDVLGCRVERVLEAEGLHQLRAGMSLIDLLDIEKPLGAGPPPDPAAPNLAHVCLRIEEARWDDVIGHLRAAGVAVDDAPKRRYGADGYGLSIYLEDPEGNVVELKTPPEPDSRIVAPQL